MIGRTERSVRLRIRGLVQGVGYRLSMVEQARQLGVRGWVRNRLDGSVEALVAGPPDAVERMIEWAKRGPRGAVVAAVDIDAVDIDAGDGHVEGFEKRPTV